ncbi:eukaryotic translation initiation factor 2-alpha kinase 1-like isoform X2 [Biomphalaria glabrata]|uniref:Eukaryotic translation initiation factor 2-alpha kinase 1-like isoform X2 n=1 Tax=Biomphalaria glabrata TaxID=6526 RepID=A0A9W3A602_BIOGL|nr:eukaryotic translation initiation factor 2-alpha kinase 1-like isoform X2 [Biomphalaria glabrata]
MPKRYVDNALNRRLGRVGMIHGTAVHSITSGSNLCTYRTYVDNPLNRKLWRVGLPLGSAVYSRSSDTGSSSDFEIPISAYRPTSPNEILRETAFQRIRPSTTPDRESDSGRSRFRSDNLCDTLFQSVGPSSSRTPNRESDSGYSSISSRTHVDNTLNRTLGRAGLHLGTAVHSRSSDSSSSSSEDLDIPSSRSRSRSDNLCDTLFQRVGPSSGRTPNRESDSGLRTIGLEDRTAINNQHKDDKSSNRGLENVTAVKHKVDNITNRGLGHGAAVKYTDDNSTKQDLEHSTAVKHKDNSTRQDLEHSTAVKHKDNSTRQDLEHSTAVKHKDNRTRQDLEHSTAVKHKDNSTRQDLEHSTAVKHKDNSTRRSLECGTTDQLKVANNKRSVSSLTAHLNAFSLQETRLYKDNKLNRRLGRVGKPLGTHKYNPNQLVHKTYVDNDFNRRHNRVGKPIGSMPVTTKERFYKDNILNKELGRVGFPWGKCPDKPNATLMSLLHDLNYAEDVPDYISEIYELDVSNKETIETYFIIKEREKSVRKWLEEECRTPWEAHQHTVNEIIKNYRGQVINCKDLKFIDVIGHGHFGDVHFAEWIEGQAVAVKVLKDQSVSQRKRRDFEREILLYCELDHANIVQFLGACIEFPHLAIIMEYMDISLHEALHLKDVDIPPTDRTSVMKQMTKGLSYLHRNGIVHCDLKPHNILLNNIPGEEASNPDLPIIAKLTDFGLSFMKYDTESSASKTSPVKNIGTPRYSAPEVLRGAALFADDMMKADVYSLSLTILELLLEEVPFENLSLSQLRKQVGENELKPKMKNGHILKQPLKSLLERALSSDPAIRSSARYLSDVFESFQNAYRE